MKHRVTVARAALGESSLWPVLWRLIRCSPWLYLLNLVLQFPRQLIWLVPGLVLERLFDWLSSSHPRLDAGFLDLTALLIAATLARIAVQTGALLSMFYPLNHSAMLLRRNLLRQLLERPGALPLPYPVGDMINRLHEDVYGSYSGIAYAPAQIFAVAGFLVQATVALLVMARISLLITLVAILPTLVISATVNVAGRWIEDFHHKTRETTGQVTALLGELIGATLAIQAASAEQAVVGQLEPLGMARRHAALREYLFESVLLGTLGTSAASIGIGAVLLLVGHALHMGTFTVGDFALFVSYLSIFSVFSEMLGGTITNYRQAKVSYGRLVALVSDRSGIVLTRSEHAQVDSPAPDPDLDSPRSGKQAQVATLLEAENIHYHHPAGERGIEGIDLRLGPGQFVVVTGPVGSGKTTLLRVVLGLLPMDGGAIFWKGERITNPSAFFVPPRCAYTPQVPGLLSASLRENILLGLLSDDRLLDIVLHQVTLDHDLASFPQGVDTLVGPHGMRLSGGQVLRTAAARMLVRSPELMVFDDLSTGLDLATELILWDRIFNMESRPALLIVSHREEVLRRADSIIYLKDGRRALPPPR